MGRIIDLDIFLLTVAREIGQEAYDNIRDIADTYANVIADTRDTEEEE